MSMPPAPMPPQPRVVEISGRRFRLRPMPTRAAFRAHHSIVRACGGPLLPSLVSGEGFRVGDPDPGLVAALAKRGKGVLEDGSVVLGLGELMVLAPNRLAEELYNLSRVSTDDFMEIVEEVVVGHVDFATGSIPETWHPISNGELIDAQVPGPGALMKLAQECVKFLMGPSTAGGATSPAAPPAAPSPAASETPKPRRRSPQRTGG